MTEVSADISPFEELGAQLRSIRKARQLSLVELSRAAKVSSAMISQIETAQATPSLTTLEKLRRALDVPLGSFFSAPDPQENMQAGSIVVRREDRRSLNLPRLGLHKQLLSPGGASSLEFMELVLVANGSSGEEPWVRSGEKGGIVVSGLFILTHGTNTYKLEAGDSFQFDGSIPHKFRNGHNAETRVLWIIRADIG